ncbi:peptidyl-prolyl cis-trans isomerase FKBP20-2, chloroplastic [Olea europaea subsp. europaea]|uniref:Peptidyl-prolyl cis-trans isomerase FKBP20-2, chloroplastic n=1 Tax=Olea europaea subsp. europaea TaxID=158383 RepID=A0A8S0UNX2_OLEEU|nr:peptidyl-prolyl cis-trans isomerase FKBP20-2, chloroplastic [Olea europaea subsp. europaea]
MARKQAKNVLHFEENVRRRLLLFFFLVGLGISTALPSSGKTKNQNPCDEKCLLEQNKRIQRENNASEDFPNFVREVTSDKYVKRDLGLIFSDIAAGTGDCPKDGQQVLLVSRNLTDFLFSEFITDFEAET